MVDLFEPIARRRGLRGVALHLLPALRQSKLRFRDRGETILAPGRVQDGVCQWCKEQADTPRRTWHKTCVGYYLIARCMGTTTLGLGYDTIIPSAYCPCGVGYGVELDHIVALKIAARQGVRQYARSLLPENLQWLCRKCHTEKTREDRRKMASLDGRKPIDRLM